MEAVVSADAAKRNFGSLLSEVDRTSTPVTILRRSKPIARIVPIHYQNAIDEVDHTTRMSPLAVSNDAQFWDRIDEAREDVRNGAVGNARDLADRLRQKYVL